MCGIFGFVSSPASEFARNEFKPLIENLFLLSESRGKDASGLLLISNSEITILKRPLRAKQLLRSEEYKNTISQNLLHEDILGFMGHARMVTNGSEETHDNNQPIVGRNMCILHNGIIVNDRKLWSEFPDLERNYEVDTEVVLKLMENYQQQLYTFQDSFLNTYKHLIGANSFAILSSGKDAIILATSNGSLYFSNSVDSKELIFSSERYILEKAISQPYIKKFFIESQISQVNPGEGCLFSFEKLSPQKFSLNGVDAGNKISESKRISPRAICDLRPTKNTRPPIKPLVTSQWLISNDRFVQKVNDSVKKLRRCTRCVLPETFPFIEFNEKGVCNYCRNYKPLEFHGRTVLEDMVEKYKKTDERPDCLVPISGGRDSCYGLHYIKNVLNMNPIAYTYDWGMVTDLARRNISRMCGALEVEHILLSADIKTKRKYIRQNVLAWLKRPVLGTVPLFMAGDKQFFYYAQMLRKQMDIDLLIFSFNRLEQTDFKVAFCDIDERSGEREIFDAMANINKIKLMMYYSKEYIKNPSYINSSLLDTVFAFFSFYLVPKKYVTLFNYIQWDESVINSVLLDKYDWETAQDTDSTWRIGDGTASFYNYIYYTIAGFSENDTFRSNQIREGMISREYAIKAVEQENQPRYDSIQWYCNTIEINMKDAIKVINNVPKLYRIGI